VVERNVSQENKVGNNTTCENTLTPNEVICVGVVDTIPSTVLKYGKSYIVNQRQMWLLRNTTTTYVYQQ